MPNFSFTEKAFEEYVFWQTQDKKMMKRINQLLRDIGRSPFDGIGKPESLRGDFSGYWSRRIDDANRLIYRVTENQIEIYQCKGHYRD